MASRSFSNGHAIAFDGTVWRYMDTQEVVNHERACSRCGLCPVAVVLHHPTSRGFTTAGVDACIAPIAQALNAGGLQTAWACCGHQQRPGAIGLEDGRQLIVAKDANQLHQIDALFPLDIHGHAVEASR